MSLTELTIKAAKGKDKPYKVYDERGLFLLVTPTGARLWRFKYKHDGVEKLISLGIYPDVKLKDARDRRDEARRLIAANVDPSAKRRAEKSTCADPFGAVAKEWLETKKGTLSAGTWQRDRDQLVRLVGPYLANRPIAGRVRRDISADLKAALAPKGSQSYAAITDPAKVGQLLCAIDRYDGQRTTHAALRLAPYVFVGESRPNE